MKFTLSIDPGEGDPGFSFFSIPLPRGRFRSGVEAFAWQYREEPIELWELGRWPDGSLRVVQGLIPRYAGIVTLEVKELERPKDEAKVFTPAESFSFHGHRLEWDQASGLYALSHEGRTYFDPALFALSFRCPDRGVVGFGASVEGVRVLHHRQDWLKIEATVGDGGVGLRFRIQWDLFKGIPGCVVSVMAIHDRPGVDLLELESVEVTVGMRGDGILHGVHQKKSGFELTESRCVETAASLDIRAEGGFFRPRVVNFDALEDDRVYGPHLNPPPDEVDSLCWLRQGEQRLVIDLEHMPFLRPKGIRMDGVRAIIGIWPQWAGRLHWRQGCRRQIRLAVGVLEDAGNPDFRAMRRLASSLLDTQRARVSVEAFREAAFFDVPWLPSCRPDRHPRIEGWFQAISSLQTIAGFFDFGDTPDSHYTRTYYPLGRVPLREGDTGSTPDLAMTSGRMPVARGSMDGRDPVFVNNEYDVLHCLASEAIRTGNALLFRQLGWFARHTIEVDFICFSDWETRHRAQGAHSVGHTSGGAYPSHFWTQGLAQYYFLTGDDDAREIIEALADKTIWYFNHPRLAKLGSGINREMGWAVLTLVSAYEVTLKEEYLHAAEQLLAPVLADPLPADLPVFSFGHTSLLLGCKAYIEALERSERTRAVQEWYLAVVRLAIRSAWAVPEGVDLSGKPKLSYDFERLEKGVAAAARPRSGILDGYGALACLAYAWRLTGDQELVRAGVRTIRVFIDGTPGYFSTSMVFRAPLPEGKPFAMSYRTFAEYFAALAECGWLEEFEFPGLAK
jgi:hypothetical protein